MMRTHLSTPAIVVLQLFAGLILPVIYLRAAGITEVSGLAVFSMVLLIACSVWAAGAVGHLHLGPSVLRSALFGALIGAAAGLLAMVVLDPVALSLVGGTIGYHLALRRALRNAPHRSDGASGPAA